MSASSMCVQPCGDVRAYERQRVVGDRGQAAERSTDLVEGSIGELGAINGRPSQTVRSFTAVLMPAATGRHTLLPTSFISHSDLRSAQTNSAMIRASSWFVPARRWSSSDRNLVSTRDINFPGNRAMLGSEADLTTGAGAHPGALAA